MNKSKDTIEYCFRLVFLLCGIVAVACVLSICVYLVISGIPAIAEIGICEFLFGNTWNSGTGQFGILPFILTSIYGTAGAVILGVPIGLLTAVFLGEGAAAEARRRTAHLCRTAGRYSVGCLRVGRHDGTGSVRTARFSVVIRRLLAFGYPRFDRNDTAVHRQRIGDSAESSA